MAKRFLQLLLLTLILMSCGGGSQQAKNEGSGSEIVGVTETTSSETTRIVSRGSIAIDTAMIFLLPIDHEANGSFIENIQARSSSDGTFSIDDVQPGRYILEAMDSTSSGVRSRATAVQVMGDGKQVNVGTLNLDMPGTVNCTVAIPSQISILGFVEFEYELFILGTRIKSSGDESSATINLANIPTGTPLTIKAVMTKPSSLQVSKDIPTILPGKSVNVNISTTDWF